MPAPLERDRQYVDKFLAEQWNLTVDFTERLTTGVFLTSPGNSVQFIRESDKSDQTTFICNPATLALDFSGLMLIVQLIPQAASTPTDVGDNSNLFRGIFIGKTTQGALEEMEVWVRLRGV
jgi:hypothetical protein